MEASQTIELTKEKQQAILISSYKQAVALLHGTNTQQQGEQMLSHILKNPDTHEPALRQLRLSTLLSFAELSKMKGENMNALYYWHEATQLDPAFNTWLKMAQTLQSLKNSYFEASEQEKRGFPASLAEIENQIEYVYKNAIRQSPPMWRKQLMEKLHKVYLEHGKKLQAGDLSEIIKLNNYDEIMGQKEARQQQEQSKKHEKTVGYVTRRKLQFLSEVAVPLDRIMCGETQTHQVLPPWDYLLSFCCLFLSNSSNFKKGSKKHEEILTKLSKSSQCETLITFKAKKQDIAQDMIDEIQGEQLGSDLKDGSQDDQQQKLNMLILDYYKETMKEKEGNQISKAKKTQAHTVNYSSKTVFESVQDYVKEISGSKSLNLQLLHAFKYIDPFYNPGLQLLSDNCGPVFDATFGLILSEPHPPEKQNCGQNQEQVNANGRERRLVTHVTPQLATPVRRQSNDQSKMQQQKQGKLKGQFVKVVNSLKGQTFPNIIQVSQNLILHILQIYKKIGLMDELSTDGNQECRRSTNKLISILMGKIIEVTETALFDNPDIRKLAYMIMIKSMEDELSGNISSNARIANLHNYLLAKCLAQVDSSIYKNSKLRSLNKQHCYELEDLQQLLQLIHIGILLCTLPLPVNEAQLTKLIKSYQQLYSLYTISINDDSNPILVSRVLPPSKVEEIVENRIRKAKIKQFGQQECEQSVMIANIDKLLKTDMKNSEIIESVKTILTLGSGSLLLYLKSFTKVVDILFSSFENNSGFNVRFVQNSLKAMEIPMLIEALHNKLTQGKKTEKEPKQNKQKEEEEDPDNLKKSGVHVSITDAQRSDYKIKVQTIFNLLKLYMMNELDQANSSLCLRITFYLLQDTFKTMVQFQKNNMNDLDIHYLHSDQICQIIIFLDSLVKMKESSELRKKFYHRILIRNIRYIYDLYNHSISGHNEIRVQVYKIYNETFHNKSFKPKKIEDCLGYFLMISREFSSEFDKQVVQFEQKMKRVFNQCYLIFKEEFKKSFQECERFTRAMEFFVSVMRKKRKQCQQFINFFTGKQQICDCCQGPYLSNNIGRQPFAKEVLFVVAKFLENKRSPSSISSKEQINQSEDQVVTKEGRKPTNFIELDDEIERYYLRYFLVAINTGKAWHEMLRFQVSKVYQSFDILTGPEIESAEELPVQNQPRINNKSKAENISEVYKHKFKYAKTIASFIIKNFDSPDFWEAKQYALYRINIMNTLKICQRKLNRNLSEIEKVPSQIRLFTSKYMEGVVTVMAKKKQTQDQQFSIGESLPEISFLLYTQFKLPFMLYNCQHTEQMQESTRLLDITLRDGISLVSKIKANGTMNMMEGEEGENLSESKYNVSHLDKELKIQIIGSLSQVILNSLKFIQDVSSLMKKDSITSDPRSLTFVREKSREIAHRRESEVFHKLQLLVEVGKVIQSYEQVFQQWKEDCRDPKEMELPQKSEQVLRAREKPLEFKDKYLFPDYLSAINSIQKIFEKFVRIFEGIAKHNMSTRLRKQNYSRYIFSCKLWLSKIYSQLGCRQLSLNYVKEISNLKNEDLVSFYHHYENEPTEQNLILAEYYSRNIVFHCLKIEAIQHLLEVYSLRPQTIDTCILLIRKLSKMFVQKLEPEKDKTKAKAKEEAVKESEDLKKNTKQKQPQKQLEQKQKKPKKEQKQSKEAKEKGSKMEKKTKWMYVLFLRGVELYFEALIKTTNARNEPMDDKLEKALLQFKNKIKRQIQRDRKKPPSQTTEGPNLYGINLVNDIQSFIQFYWNKFGKKIRMKAPKKSKADNLDASSNPKPDSQPSFSDQQKSVLQREDHGKGGLNIKKEEDAISEQEPENQESEGDQLIENELKAPVEEGLNEGKAAQEGYVAENMVNEEEIQVMNQEDSENL